MTSKDLKWPEIIYNCYLDEPACEYWILNRQNPSKIVSFGIPTLGMIFLIHQGIYVTSSTAKYSIRIQKIPLFKNYLIHFHLYQEALTILNQYQGPWLPLDRPRSTSRAPLGRPRSTSRPRSSQESMIEMSSRRWGHFDDKKCQHVEQRSVLRDVIDMLRPC